MNLPKRIHIIGICGVATSALGIAFKNAGVKVTGSDKGFFPPVSTELEKAGIPFYAGWHPEKMCSAEHAGGGAMDDTPDFVIAGGSGTSASNPETLYANEKGIPVISFAEALGKYVVRKNSIVCAGTWGKTTISALLSFILSEAGMRPGYFSGGVSLSHPSAALSDSDWSVVEGDEYQVSISDHRPKFAYYSPTHLLLTSVSWDHADLYPTEKDYFDAFEKLVGEVPGNGHIVACIDDAGVQKTLKNAGLATAGPKVATYGHAESADYSYHSLAQTKNGLHFQISNKDECYEIISPMLGGFNAQNMTAAFAMARTIGIPADKIIAAIRSFKGIKRRFEKRLDGDITVFDCHAPTPEKAAACLKELRSIYTGKIIAVYEPNIGGREREAAAKYDNAFKDADVVIIPRLTKLKVAEDDSNQPMEGPELAAIISKTHKDCRYIEDDAKLVETAVSQAKKGDIIVFLGSHGFRGMIEETVKKLG